MPEHALCPQSLFDALGRPDGPLIIDVCLPEDFANAPYVIPTSLRMPHTALPFETDQRPAVVICQKGKKLSQGAAALLRATGRRAKYLTGGIAAWRAAGLPLVPANSVTPRTGGRQSRWLRTEHSPKSCFQSWLMRRFLDPGALILDVDQCEAAAIAQRFGALPLPPLENLPHLRHPALDRTQTRGTAMLAELWDGLEGRADTLLDVLYAAAKATQ